MIPPKFFTSVRDEATCVIDSSQLANELHPVLIIYQKKFFKLFNPDSWISSRRKVHSNKKFMLLSNQYGTDPGILLRTSVDCYCRLLIITRDLIISTTVIKWEIACEIKLIILTKHAKQVPYLLLLTLIWDFD